LGDLLRAEIEVIEYSQNSNFQREETCVNTTLSMKRRRRNMKIGKDIKKWEKEKRDFLLSHEEQLKQSKENTSP
jgi:hypothetical protein